MIQEEDKLFAFNEAQLQDVTTRIANALLQFLKIGIVGAKGLADKLCGQELEGSNETWAAITSQQISLHSNGVFTSNDLSSILLDSRLEPNLKEALKEHGIKDLNIVANQEMPRGYHENVVFLRIK